MFFYLIHSIPHSKALTEEKRNLRTIVFGGLVYVGLHAFLFSDFIESYYESLTMLRQYFYYMLVVDLMLLIFLYKIQYDKLIITNIDFGLGSKPIPIQNTRVIHNQPVIIQPTHIEIPEYVPIIETPVQPKTEPIDKKKSSGKTKKSKEKSKEKTKKVKKKKQVKEVSEKQENQESSKIEKQIQNEEEDEVEQVIKKNLKSSNK